MILSTFLTHQKLKFFRNPRWKSGIALKILFGIFFIYLVSLSFQAKFFISEFKPDMKPVDFINSYLIYIFAGFFVSGLFLQKIPYTHVQQYLHLNILRKWIINYLLYKTLFGNKTLIVIALFTPFTFVSAMGSYSFASALIWLVNLYLLIFCINLFVQLVKLFFSINKWFRILVFMVIGGISIAKYLNFINLEQWSLPIFGFVFQNPVIIFVPISMVIILYFINFHLLKNSFYSDNFQKNHVKKSKFTNFDILTIFGENKELIRYNIRQVLRNKKCKIQFIIFSIFPFIYSLQLIDKIIENDGVILVYLISMITYIFFWLNHFSLFFSWDTKTFDFLHTENIKIADFVYSKIIAVLFLSSFHYLPGFVLIYISPKYFFILLSVILLHYGIFTFFIIYTSMLGIKKMDINRSPFFNYEGASSVQFFISLPLITIPIIPIIIFYKNPQHAYMINSFAGLIGLLLANKFVNIINNKYQKDKYIILDELR